MMINRQMATCLIAFCMTAGVSIASNRSIYSNVKDSTDDKTTAVKQKENNLNGTEKAAKDKEKELPYDQLIKRTGSVQNGLFTIRHIDDKWYFEIADSLLGRYILAVTRFTGVPQSFGKFSGEAINQQTLYFEQRNAKTMLLRAYVLSQEADPNSRISKTLKASTVDPIIASFKIIGRNKTTGAQLIDVTPLFAKDNGVVSISANSAKQLKLGALQPDRTFIDTMKVYPINIEVATTRTYNSTPSTTPASYTESVTILRLPLLLQSPS